MNDQQPGSARRKLGRVALIGSALQMAGRGVRALVGIATVAILARFLSPADFGAFALVYAVVMLAQVFADLGLRVALVQKQEISDIECQSVFWASTAAGALLTAGLLLFSAPIATLVGDPAIDRYFVATAPIFLIIGMRGVPLALLERRFQFKEIAATDLSAAIVGSLVAIALALSGSTIGALVAQQVAMIVVLAVMLFAYARWLPRFQFSREALKPLMRYGGYVTLTGVLQTTSAFVDRPLIGNRLSTADLGYLTMADQIVMTPVRVVATNVRRVTFPLLSSFQSDDSRIISAHRRTLHALGITLAPCLFGLAALAEPFSMLLLGPGWAPVATIMAIISLRALLNSVGEVNGAVFASKGMARLQFQWSIFSLFVNVGALLASLPFGIEAVAASRVFSMMVVLLPLHSWFLARALGTTTATLLMPLLRPVLAALLMALAVYTADRAMAVAEMALVVRAAAGIVLGASLYIGFVCLIDRKGLTALVNWSRSR